MIPLHMPGEWRHRGACIGADPELFFAAGSTSHARDRARAICATCPVKDPCLEHAIHEEQVGIWGATSRNERNAMRRARGMTHYRPALIDITDVWERTG